MVPWHALAANVWCTLPPALLFDQEAARHQQCNTLAPTHPRPVSEGHLLFFR